MKIGIILPYFGNLPCYFDLWLQSASYNKEFDFLIFTDNEERENLSNNIKWVNMSLEDIKHKIEGIVNFKVVLHIPYKLCDYRPMYGLIFEDFLTGYDWWGHCDPDMIFGNMKKYITPQLLNEYDKIYELGHLTLYKNNDKVNNLWRMELKEGAYSYKDAFRTRYATHFDEQLGMIPICESLNIKTYKKNDFADIKVGKGSFQRCWDRERGQYPRIFRWKNGSLYGYISINGNIEIEEYIYVHLQKRTMEIKDKSKMLQEDFVIEPNSILKFDERMLTSEYIQESNLKLSDESINYKAKLKLRFTNLMKGSIKNKIIRKIKKIKIPQTY